MYGSRPEFSAWRELAPSGPLITTCLIDPLDDSGTPEHRISIRVSKRVLTVVHGDYSVDPEIVGLVPFFDVRPDSLLVVDEDVRTRVRRAASSSTGIVMVTGAAGTGRRSLLVRSIHAARHDVITVDAAALSSNLATCERQLRVL